MAVKEKTKRIRHKRKNKDVWNNQLDIVRIANSSINDNLSQIKVPTLGLSEKYIYDNTKKNNKPVRFNYFKCVIDSFKDVFTMLLVFIAIYNYVMFGVNGGDFADLAGGILVTVLISVSVLFDVFTNRAIFRANVSMAKTQIDYQSTLRNVLFDESKRPIATKDAEDVLLKRLSDVKQNELLVGDIIFLEEGDIVPADCRIIRSTDFMVDQEVLDGVKTPVEKKLVNTSLSSNPLNLTNIVYRGTTVVSGTCWAVVVYKDGNTLYSHKKSVNTPAKQTSSFKEQVKKVTKILITTMLIFVPTIFLLVGILNGAYNPKGFGDYEVWMDAFVFAMAIAVALSPDALPFMLNAVFARSRVVLSRKQIDISDLSSIQNIGAMDVLAIDVDSIFSNDDLVIQEFADLSGYNDKKIVDIFALTAIYKPLHNPRIQKSVLESPARTQELAELKANYKFLGEVYDLNEVYLKFIDIKNKRIIYLRRTNIPGAIQKSSYFADSESMTNELTQIHKTRVINAHNFVIDPYSFGLTAVSVPDTPVNEAMDAKIPTKKLTYLGHISFGSTIKSGSDSIIEAIRKENVRPVLVTDKTLNQGMMIAQELDVEVTNSLSGDQIDAMTDQELMKLLNKTNLFYAISINTQIRLLKVFKKHKNVIGFLGKDVWDSYQMQVADVGITLDTSDTYGKQCATLIINHLNLMQLITAIQESRKALTNMIKYIKLKVTGTISLTMKMIIGVLLFNHEPMGAVQLLVQNLAYDGIEYSIAFDKVSHKYLEKPTKWNTKSIIPFAAMNVPIIAGLNLINIIIMVFAMYPGIFSAVRDGQGFNGLSAEETLKTVQTAYFVEDSVSHLVFVFVARDNYKWWWQERPSKITWWSMVGGIIFFIIVTVIPGLNSFFQTDALKWYWYIMLIVQMIILMFCVDQIKRVWRKKNWSWL